MKDGEHCRPSFLPCSSFAPLHQETLKHPKHPEFVSRVAPQPGPSRHPAHVLQQHRRSALHQRSDGRRKAEFPQDSLTRGLWRVYSVVPSVSAPGNQTRVWTDLPKLAEENTDSIRVPAHHITAPSLRYTFTLSSPRLPKNRGCQSGL